MVVLDESSSITFVDNCPEQDCYEVEKQFALTLLERLSGISPMFGSGGGAGYAEFSDDRWTDSSEHSVGWIDESFAAFKEAFAALAFSGGRTSIGSGLQRGKGLLLDVPERESHAQAMIVITDGNDNEGSDYVQQADDARDQGIAVFAVGVTDRVDHATLLNIAGGASSRVFWVEDFADLSSELAEQVESAVSDYCDVDMTLDLLLGPSDAIKPKATAGSWSKKGGGSDGDDVTLTWSVAETFGSEGATLTFDLPVCLCAYIPTIAVHSAIDLSFAGVAVTPLPPSVQEAGELMLEVVDDVPPTLICPDNVSVDRNTCLSPYTEIVVPTAEASDNCGIEDVVQVGVVDGNSAKVMLGEPQSFPVGNTIVSLVATDVHGLQKECSFSIRVDDIADGKSGCPTAPPTPAPTPSPTSSGQASGQIVEHSVIQGRITVVEWQVCPFQEDENQDGSASSVRAKLVEGINAAFGVDNGVILNLSCSDGGVTSTEMNVSGRLRQRHLTSESSSATLIANFAVDYYTTAESTAATKSARGMAQFAQFSSFTRFADILDVRVENLSVDQIGYSQVSEKLTNNPDESFASGQSIAPLQVGSQPGWGTTLLTMVVLSCALTLFACTCGCFYWYRKRQLRSRFDHIRSRLEEWNVVPVHGIPPLGEQGEEEEEASLFADHVEKDRQVLNHRESISPSHTAPAHPPSIQFKQSYGGSSGSKGLASGANRSAMRHNDLHRDESKFVDIGGLDYDEEPEGEEEDASMPLSQRFGRDVVDAVVRRTARGGA